MKEQYRIAAKRSLTPEIGQISVEAPLIAARAKAGQFIILRVDEAGERIPLTISSAQDGKVTVVYQKVGGTTLALDQLQEGDCLHDFVGPLGTPTHVEGYRRVAVLGDMGELGDLTDQAHFNAGALAAMLGIDFVIAIGSKAARIADGAAMSGGDVVHFATKEEALPTVREQLRPNTSMLIKASHSMRFERLTEDLRKYYD